MPRAARLYAAVTMLAGLGTLVAGLMSWHTDNLARFICYFLIANLLGLAVGPTVTALVASWFFTGKLAIVDAMTVCYPLLTGLNLLFLAVFALRLKRWQPVRAS